MNHRDPDGLIARIRQVGRLRAARDQPVEPANAPPAEQLRTLEARLAHLEQMVEGLQDSVHRESERHAKLISEIQAQIQPEAMGASLADNARNRGL